MDGVKPVERVRHGVGLNEVATDVSRLRLEVYAENAESGELIAAGSATSSREQIKKRGPSAVRPAGGALPLGVAESRHGVRGSGQTLM